MQGQAGDSPVCQFLLFNRRYAVTPSILPFPTSPPFAIFATCPCTIVDSSTKPVTCMSALFFQGPPLWPLNVREIHSQDPFATCHPVSANSSHWKDLAEDQKVKGREKPGSLSPPSLPALVSRSIAGCAPTWTQLCGSISQPLLPVVPRP